MNKSNAEQPAEPAKDYIIRRLGDIPASDQFVSEINNYEWLFTTKPSEAVKFESKEEADSWLVSGLQTQHIPSGSYRIEELTRSRRVLKSITASGLSTPSAVIQNKVTVSTEDFPCFHSLVERFGTLGVGVILRNVAGQLERQGRQLSLADEYASVAAHERAKTLSRLAELLDNTLDELRAKLP